MWKDVLPCSIGQSCCSMTSKRSMGWFLESSQECSLNQSKATRVCMCSIYQSNRSISVCLLFLYCSRVFISRSYENRSNIAGKLTNQFLRPEAFKTSTTILKKKNKLNSNPVLKLPNLDARDKQFSVALRSREVGSYKKGDLFLTPPPNMCPPAEVFGYFRLKFVLFFF